MDEFWESIVKFHGRNLLYVDSSAILGTLERGNDKFDDLFASLVGYTYVTSTYVVAETVRRLAKSKPGARFCGPAGEQRVQLARYLLRTWLDDHFVRIICIPSEIFTSICAEYHGRNAVQCDLTDLISFTIVDRLKLRHIISDDEHFRELGLACLPSDTQPAA